MRVERIDPGLPAARELLTQSDEYMASLYPAESNHLENAEALRKPNVSLFGCFIGDKLAGCGAVKLLEDGEEWFGEVKRLFVASSCRGRGVSTMLMEKLEEHLLKEGVSIARLELGVSQPEALSLYRRRGYQERGPFGSYQPDPLSIFMEKRSLPACVDTTFLEPSGRL